MGRATRYIMLVGAAVALGACTASQTASIVSNPNEVVVAVNGQRIGITPTKFNFQFPGDLTRHTVSGSKEGYHDAAVVVTENSLKMSGKVNLKLESHDRQFLIISEPGLATVTIGERRSGDQEVGRTPVEHTFNFADRGKRYKVVISKPGFFDQKFFVTERDPIDSGSGEIEVVLEEDPAWTSTSESEATNRWLRIPVNPAIDHANAWQKVIDSVTTVYNSLEQLDQVSGYIRSAPRIRQYDTGPEGTYYVRTQFIGSISSMDPLTYKIKLIAKKRLEVESNENWKDFERVFAEDAQLVEELLNRLGLK